MRGWVLVAAISMALVATPMWAQRGGGGGHGGAGGGHASFAGHAGSVSSFHSSAGYRGGYGSGWRGNGGYGGYRYPYRYYGGYRGYRGYPYWGYAGYGGWYYPWWGWNDFDNSSYDSDGEVAQNYPSYGYPPPGGSVASYAGPDEVQRIQDEVSQLRAQQEARRSQPQEPLIHADTVLVYRDGHTETVGNYAIAGNTLWVFNQSSAKKVPLSDLNLPATKTDNEEHGVEFVLPNSR